MYVCLVFFVYVCMCMCMCVCVCVCMQERECKREDEREKAGERVTASERERERKRRRVTARKDTIWLFGYYKSRYAVPLICEDISLSLSHTNNPHILSHTRACAKRR